MLHSFFKIAFRNLSRNKGFAFINILGLSIGMAAALLIFLWVRHELTFDRFHEKTDRIGLIYSREANNGVLDAWPRTTALAAPELKQDYVEVEDAVRFNGVYFLVTVGDKHFNIGGAFADPGLLTMFSYPLLEGNAAGALSDPHSIVLTEHVAIQLFGKEDAIGKTVRIDSTDNFTVTGVLKDLPSNTEMDFGYLLPWTYLRRLGWDRDQTWSYTNSGTYVLLRPGASMSALDAKIRNLVKTHVSAGDASTRELFIQPLEREHLYSRLENGELVAGRIDMVRMFITVALFILLIACINFMNLSTARSERRAREVGIRKVVGAYRASLIAQFIGESLLVSVIAFAAALLIVQLSLDGFGSLVGLKLSINYGEPKLWLFAFAFIVVTGLVAGSYPAFYLSASQPSKILKGRSPAGSALVTPRKILVVLQFTFAIALVTCTLVVERQVRYARNRDSGYQQGGLVFNFGQGEVDRHYDLIKHDLVSSGAVTSVTRAFSPIIRVWGTISDLAWQGSTPGDKKLNFLQYGVDADFTKTMGTRLVEGRDIDVKEYPTDTAAILLNQAAVHIMHLKDPVGKTISDINGNNWHVVGIIKDFIIQSPYEEIKPMIIQGQSNGYVIHFRLNPAHSTADNLAKAERIFKEYNPQYPFEYNFVDEAYANKFKEEKQEGTLAALFAGLTVFISCLGLFALAAYMAESRTKEIGVRKVLGASVTQITALLSGGFLKLVIIAILIATPIAWLAMHNWLQGYAYRITLRPWLFAASGLLALLIAFITVSYQSIRAATSNPVNSLRSE